MPTDGSEDVVAAAAELPPAEDLGAESYAVLVLDWATKRADVAWWVSGEAQQNVGMAYSTVWRALKRLINTNRLQRCGPRNAPLFNLPGRELPPEGVRYRKIHPQGPSPAPRSSVVLARVEPERAEPKQVAPVERDVAVVSPSVPSTLEALLAGMSLPKLTYLANAIVNERVQRKARLLAESERLKAEAESL